MFEDEQEQGEPMRIWLVLHGSIAEKLGIRSGDSIVSLAGKRNLSYLETYLGLSLRSKELTIVVRRGEEELAFIVPAPIPSKPSAAVLDK